MWQKSHSPPKKNLPTGDDRESDRGKGQQKAKRKQGRDEIFFGCDEKVVLPSRVKEEEGRKRKILNIFTAAAAAFSAVQYSFTALCHGGEGGRRVQSQKKVQQRSEEGYNRRTKKIEKKLDEKQKRRIGKYLGKRRLLARRG